MRGFSKVLLAVVVSGCYSGVGPVDGEGAFRTTEVNNFRLNNFRLNNFKLNNFRLNSFKLNTFKLNSFKLNDFELNTFRLNTFRLNGFKLNDFELNTFRLNGSEFEAVFVVDGVEFVRSGVELKGSEFGLIGRVVEEGQDSLVEYTLRIDDVYPDPDADTDDILLYELSYRREGGEDEWQSPCVDDYGASVPAIPIVNGWDEVTGDRIDDPDLVTLACADAVIAHCVQWGYRPWVDAEQCKDKKGKKKSKDCDEVSLADYHQACTRMARADYCGDGTPWTVSGHVIDIWDHLSPQVNARAAEDWKIEAEWTPEGAYCLNDIRQQKWKAEGLYPSCGKAFDKHNKKVKDCGSMKKHRSLLTSSFEMPPKEDKKKGKK